jgi:hypothetical protein
MCCETQQQQPLFSVRFLKVEFARRRERLHGYSVARSDTAYPSPQHVGVEWPGCERQRAALSDQRLRHILFRTVEDRECRRFLEQPASTICTALEVHATLEEEIFYPAVREVTEDEFIRESMAEHEEMKRLIGLLRRMQPEAIDYDETVMALMREVLHHVADEETIVLPAAERMLGDSLGELGARMTKRRVQLVAPRSGEIALDMGRAVSGNTAALSIAALATLGLLWAGRSRNGRRRMPRLTLHR